MKKKWVYIILAILLIFIGSQWYISINYVYSPLTYPKGNIATYDLSYVDFKKPIIFSVVKWEEDGTKSIYQYDADQKEIKKLFDHFDRAEKLANYNKDTYLAELEEKGDSPTYNISFRQGKNFDENGVAIGRKLINFNFYGNNDVFEVSDVHFFKLEEDFKNEIFSLLNSENKIQ